MQREHPGRMGYPNERQPSSLNGPARSSFGAATSTPNAVSKQLAAQRVQAEVIRKGDIRLRLDVEGLNGFAAMKETLKEMGYDSDEEGEEGEEGEEIKAGEEAEEGEEFQEAVEGNEMEEGGESPRLKDGDSAQQQQEPPPPPSPEYGTVGYEAPPPPEADGDTNEAQEAAEPRPESAAASSRDGQWREGREAPLRDVELGELPSVDPWNIVKGGASRQRNVMAVLLLCAVILAAIVVTIVLLATMAPSGGTSRLRR